MTVSVLAVLALVALFWLFRIAGTGGPLVSDAAFLHYPIYHWNFSWIASGTLPLWWVQKEARKPSG